MHFIQFGSLGVSCGVEGRGGGRGSLGPGPASLEFIAETQLMYAAVLHVGVTGSVPLGSRSATDHAVCEGPRCEIARVKKSKADQESRRLSKACLGILSSHGSPSRVCLLFSPERSHDSRRNVATPSSGLRTSSTSPFTMSTTWTWTRGGPWSWSVNATHPSPARHVVCVFFFVHLGRECCVFQ